MSIDTWEAILGVLLFALAYGPGYWHGRQDARRKFRRGDVMSAAARSGYRWTVFDQQQNVRGVCRACAARRFAREHQNTSYVWGGDR